MGELGEELSKARKIWKFVTGIFHNSISTSYDINKFSFFMMIEEAINK